MSLALIIILMGLIVSVRFRGVLVPVVFYSYTAGGIGDAQGLTIAIVVSSMAISAYSMRRRLHVMSFDVLDLMILVFFSYYIFVSTLSDGGAAAVKQALFCSFSFLSLYFLWRMCGLLQPLPQLIREIALGFCLIGGLLALTAVGAGLDDANGVQAARLTVGQTTAVGLSQPLPYALLCAFAAPTLFKGRIQLVVLLISGLAAAATLYFSVLNGTRGIFVSCVLGAVLYCVLSMPARITVRWFLAACIFVLLASTIIALNADYISQEWPGLARVLDFDRYGQAYDPSSVERMFRFDAAWSLFEQNRILGAGAGEFDRLTAMDYPHNLFLELLSEAGALGFLIMTAWLVFGFYRLFVMVRISRANEIRLLCCIVFVGCVQQQFSFSLASGKGLTLIGFIPSVALWYVAELRKRKPVGLSMSGA